MSLADWLSGRKSHAGRLPEGIDELRGPAKGVIVLPRHLAFPGMRECDVTDDTTRRRFLNPDLLRADWPVIKDALDPKLRGTCERRFSLDGQAAAEV
jgi:hypothetical protein